MLVEREHCVAEVIGGGDAAEKNEVVGQLMQEGATLSLHADVSYELEDAPSKAEPVKSHQAGQLRPCLLLSFRSPKPMPQPPRHLDCTSEDLGNVVASPLKLLSIVSSVS